MILIGQYDSSYVRRVAIAMMLYDLPFEHRPWSIFGDAERLARYTPLLRVPTLVLDDGDVLVETFPILDYLDHRAPPGRSLIPAEEPARHRVMQVCALASGLADLFASLYYEVTLHAVASSVLIERRRRQILATLSVLEAARARQPGPFWFGDALTHADIAVAATLRHLEGAHPGLAPMDQLPALARLAETLEALPVFQAISQPFAAPTA